MSTCTSSCGRAIRFSLTQGVAWWVVQESNLHLTVGENVRSSTLSYRPRVAELIKGP